MNFTVKNFMFKALHDFSADTNNLLIDNIKK